MDIEWDTQASQPLYAPTATPGLTELLMVTGADALDDGGPVQRLKSFAMDRLMGALGDVGLTGIMGAGGLGGASLNLSARQTARAAEALVQSRVLPGNQRRTLLAEEEVAATIDNARSVFRQAYEPDLGGYTFFQAPGTRPVSAEDPAPVFPLGDATVQRDLLPERLNTDDPRERPDASRKEILDAARGSPLVRVVSDVGEALSIFYPLVGGTIDLMVGTRMAQALGGSTPSATPPPGTPPPPVIVRTMAPNQYLECHIQYARVLRQLGTTDANSEIATTLGSGAWVFQKTTPSPRHIHTGAFTVPTLRADRVLQTHEF